MSDTEQQSDQPRAEDPAPVEETPKDDSQPEAEAEQEAPPSDKGDKGAEEGAEGEDKQEEKVRKPHQTPMHAPGMCSIKFLFKCQQPCSCYRYSVPMCSSFLYCRRRKVV